MNELDKAMEGVLALSKRGGGAWVFNGCRIPNYYFVFEERPDRDTLLLAIRDCEGLIDYLNHEDEE